MRCDYRTNFLDKIDNLRSKINVYLLELLYIFESFLKAVTIFDFDLDKEYIANKIDFSGKILIDSLYYFNLQDLSIRWQKTVDIINFNQIVKNNSSMLEILKYLTTVSDNLVKLFS